MQSKNYERLRRSYKDSCTGVVHIMGLRSGPNRDESSVLIPILTDPPQLLDLWEYQTVYVYQSCRYVVYALCSIRTDAIQQLP